MAAVPPAGAGVRGVGAWRAHSAILPCRRAPPAGSALRRSASSRPLGHGTMRRCTSLRRRARRLVTGVGWAASEPQRRSPGWVNEQGRVWQYMDDGQRGCWWRASLGGRGPCPARAPPRLGRAWRRRPRPRRRPRRPRPNESIWTGRWARVMKRLARARARAAAGGPKPLHARSPAGRTPRGGARGRRSRGLGAEPRRRARRSATRVAGRHRDRRDPVGSPPHRGPLPRRTRGAGAGRRRVARTLQVNA